LKTSCTRTGQRARSRRLRTVETACSTPVVVVVEVEEEGTNLSSSRDIHKCKSHKGNTYCRRDDLGKQVLHGGG
jgi:hypothetical protein